MITATIGRDHYRTEIIASGKTLWADEPEELGGTDVAPAPGEFLMVALASCTAITLRMYADRKQWPVEQIRVEVGFEKVETKTIFKRDVALYGDLSEEQQQRLLQIANSCPVHKTLMHPIEIITQLI
ncbi:MAG: OsmC family protein [Cyclobacteriaceae bacterium]|jgi:putative redox protein|nr:OsmC family protein [Cyclobacteriaceae bacterium]